MLPFLKRKNDSGVSNLIVQERKPDSDKPENKDSGIDTVSEDLCKALESKDYSAVSAALRAAFQILDSEPHTEGPDEDDNEAQENEEY